MISPKPRPCAARIRASRLGLALGWTLLLPVAAAAQADPSGPSAVDAPSGAVALRVVDASTLEPIQGVEVRVADAPLRTTDDDGRVLLTGAPAGPMIFTARHLGYGTTTHVVQVPSIGTLRQEVRLTPRAIALEPIEVEVDAPPRLSPRMAAFHRRMERRSGTFITREELARRDGTPLTRIIAAEAPGYRLMCDGRLRWTRCQLQSRRSAPASFTSRAGDEIPCPSQYYLDGMMVELPQNDLDRFLRAGDLEAIEVYSGPSRTPAEFNRGRSRCGVILLWSREGGSTGGGG